MAGLYPDTTLYRPPTADDIARRTLAAQSPSASADAAKTAAAKAGQNISAAFNTSGGYDPSGGGIPSSSTQDNNRAAAEEASRKAWNSMTEDQQRVMQIGDGTGPSNNADFIKAMQAGLPAWNKASGEAAINQTGGKPRLLNVGYGSTIVGSGSGSHGQANNFVGVGTGAAPAGPAGVFGNTGKAPTQLDTMHQQLADLNARQKMFSESGTLQGKLQAVALSKQAQRLSSQIYTEMMSQHAMGTLGLETQKAYPDIQTKLAAQERTSCSQRWAA
jgi:hypothetical protein